MRKLSLQFRGAVIPVLKTLFIFEQYLCTTFFIVEQWSCRYPCEHVQIVRYRFARRFCGWRTYTQVEVPWKTRAAIGLNATVIYPSMTSKPPTSAAPLRSLSSSRVLCRGCVLILLFRQLYRMYMISTGRQGDKSKKKKKRNER